MAEQSQILAAPSETVRAIEELIEKFSRNLDSYKNPQYKEDQCRIEFINPFFDALGWDIVNRQGAAEQYKDVVYEDTLSTAGATKAPDYSFRIGGIRKFFLEAKKPAINLKTDPGPALQLRSYAWSAKLPLSILTDFEEFAVYDCRIIPDEKDRADTARVQYLSFDQYLAELNWIYSRFSKEAIIKGSFDKFAESAKGLGPKVPVDVAFLKEIERWREILAKNIALRNPKLDIHPLNDAVQRTIDRIVFLRIAEDRGIERYQQLFALTNCSSIYKRLCELFYKSEDKYNSGLFDFKKDTFTTALKIDDKVLKEIIEDLYFPKSPYRFSVIGAEILGNIYEQFLGKVIRLTAGHQAKVEEKPEVKKAGGVYYTPKYIVDYIVKNTVGKLIADVHHRDTEDTEKNDKVLQQSGLNPKQISSIRILDPACGSGSFLLGAYQYLLDYHLRWYVDHQAEIKKINEYIYQGFHSQYFLTTKEKKRILLNNIFGVDIDPQAVEVTKLSLLLKVLENENEETLKKQLQLFHERALPDLDNNIKCGNSLIGTDFFKIQQTSLFDDEQKYKINAFDWESEFPEIFHHRDTEITEKNRKNSGLGTGEPVARPLNSGFDVIIGNPPYVRQGSLEKYFMDYAKTHYQTFTGMADLYVYFIEKAHKLLKNGGHFGMICSNKFMRANYGSALRSFLASQVKLEKIVDFGELPIFQDAATFPAIILTENTKTKDQKFVYAPIKRLSFQSLDDEVSEIGNALDSRSLQGDNWTLAKQEEINIIEKMKATGIPLGKYVNNKIYRGVLTGLNEAFVIDKATKDKLIKKDKKSSELIKPFVVGDDIRKYKINFQERYLILIPNGWTRQNSKGAKDVWKWFESSYPAIAEYLEQFEAKASKRWDKGEYWWELRPCDYLDKFEKPKIIYPVIAKESRFALDKMGYFSNDKTFFIPLNDFYLLGILNSKLSWLFLKRLCSVLGDPDKKGRLELRDIYLRNLPIKPINSDIPKEKSIGDQIVSLVEKILDLNKKLSSAKSTDEKTRLEREVEATDREIDNLVYELYGLTEEEVSIIEQNG